MSGAHYPAVLLLVLAAIGCGGNGSGKVDRPSEKSDAGVRNDSPKPSGAPPAAIPLTLSLSDSRPVEVSSDGYVSSKKCVDCHPREHATWYASYHRTMTQVASAESVFGDFNNVSLAAGKATFKLQCDGDLFTAIVERPDTAFEGAPPLRIEVPIVMTTGSHHMQVYWYATDQQRALGIFPFLYLKDEGRWIPRRSAFLSPADKPPEPEVGLWNMVCCRCHSTHPKPRPITPSAMDTQVAQLGIACEACHGPAERHVALHEGQGKNAADQARAIINPRRLPAERSAQICGSCHSVNLFRTRGEFEAWGDEGFRYRPGERLEDSRHVVNRTEPQPDVVRERLTVDPSYFDHLFWSDGMIRVSGREYNGLIRSPCYEGGQMSCVTCHVMHQSPDDPRPRDQWANDQLKPELDGNRACVKCHDAYAADETLTAHTHHGADSAGSNCYNCHMPYTTYGLLKAIRSHQIDSPSVAASLSTSRPNACNQCHLDKTLTWTSDYLAEWYGIDESPDLNDEHKTVAASILWSLKGDAGQRALMAWSMGWPAAQEASRTEWMAPYLSVLLNDPYDAVRFIAHRSLGTLPGYKDFEYDFVGPATTREADAQRVLSIWQESESGRKCSHDALLIDPSGALRRDEISRLLNLRNDQDVDLHE